MSSQKTVPVWGFALLLVTTSNAKADHLIQDDLVVVGSTCIGVDCSNGETFNFDTIRLKENNLRIKFQDTSNAGGFPTVDWQLTANESANGGANYFAIENIDGNSIPFKVMHGAGTHSLYVHSNGYVGLGTAVPGLQLQITDGNSPGIRLEQDSTSGFAAQTWDVSGNETNFFVRDVSSGGLLPFRIQTGAPNASLYIANDGDVGLGTTSPDGQLDVAHASDSNNHAFLIDSNSNVGVNIDNGVVPRGLLDVQTTGGVSRLMVHTDGKVGIGMGTAGTPTQTLHVKRDDGTNSVLIEEANGTAALRDLMTIRNNGGTRVTIDDTSGAGADWEIFTSNTGDFFIKDATNNRVMLRLRNDGQVWLGNNQLKLDASGNLTVNGNLTVTGTVNGTTIP